jgi:putative ABC transport system substrate-binding protein
MRSGNPPAGVVASLARPGGNVTGVTLIHPELSAKRTQLLKEARPRIERVAVVWNPGNAASVELLRECEDAARALAVQLQPLDVRSPVALDAAFGAMRGARPDALVSVGDGMLWSQRERIVAFAIRQRLPGMFPNRDFAEAGGLMAYAPNVQENLRRAAALVDKVLNGAKPADLPIEQPTQMTW